ncbi:hypothetical protein BC828DRAFT_374292 [Blastocladiella britannica]|nr:hypothetical protein BC828DRAFT_374292 [Blastocladiella britannica]
MHCAVAAISNFRRVFFRAMTTTTTTPPTASTAPTSPKPEAEPEPAWVEIHAAAVSRKEKMYKDPATGYSVMTAYCHRERGYCCGSACRHCPYNRVNVGNPDKLREDKARARALRKSTSSSASLDDEDLDW